VSSLSEGRNPMSVQQEQELRITLKSLLRFRNWKRYSEFLFCRQCKDWPWDSFRAGTEQTEPFTVLSDMQW